MPLGQSRQIISGSTHALSGLLRQGCLLSSWAVGQMDQGKRAQLAVQESSCSQQCSELNTSLGDLQGRTSPKAEAVRRAVGIFQALDSTGERKGKHQGFPFKCHKTSENASGIPVLSWQTKGATGPLQGHLGM